MLQANKVTLGECKGSSLEDTPTQTQTDELEGKHYAEYLAGYVAMEKILRMLRKYCIVLSIFMLCSLQR